ncbi:MAG: TRAP transporter large permease subunit [Rhodocyclaceae bacterium]|nr:TRAP transporter large permease subunit [Rhodocyclaceae bacterium]
MNAAIIFGLLIALMLTGMPISISLGLTVLTFILTMTQVPLESVALKLFTGIEKWEIMAIPFFILAGNFLTHGGVARRMINFATSLVGHFHGGLALASILACAMFALVCGSSVATVVAIGSIVLPAMVAHGYPMRFGAGVMITAGSLGILMLPSIPKVIYAISTNTSIGALFVAGLLPGTLLALMLAGVTWYIAKKNNYPRMKKATWLERFRFFRQSVWGLMLVVIIVGGIYSGAFTATEAAAMAAVYSFFVSVYVYKDLSLKDVPKVLRDSANMSAMLLYIITNAVLFSFVLANENLPAKLAEWLLSMNLGQHGFLFVVNLVLLAAGNFMEPSSIILIMAPIFFPAAIGLGINPVHFGILIDVNMEVGLCHPPVGLNLYVASGISRLGITELTKAVLPWLGTMIVFLLIVTYWPWLTLVVPKAMNMM